MSGPPPPAQYTQGVTPGEALPPGYGSQPAYGQPGQPAYVQPGQPAYVQPGQPAYVQPGQPAYVQPGPPPPPGQPMGGQVQWMTRPATIPGCPPGLEYLTQIDQLLIQQQIELVEALTGWETANKYKIKNNMGQQVYFVAEESDAMSRQCGGAQRGFTLHITDNMGQELMRVTRQFKCCSGNNCCADNDDCADEVSIEAPPGQVVGTVKQQFTLVTRQQK